MRPGSSLSIRLHEILVDDRIRIKTLIHETLALQPFDLVVDVPDVKLAVGIDIGAIADHLLDRKLVYLAMISSNGLVWSLIVALPSFTDARITS
jgi:hypothetical protein